MGQNQPLTVCHSHQVTPQLLDRFIKYLHHQNIPAEVSSAKTGDIYLVQCEKITRQETIRTYSHNYSFGATVYLFPNGSDGIPNSDGLTIFGTYTMQHVEFKEDGLTFLKSVKRDMKQSKADPKKQQRCSTFLKLKNFEEFLSQFRNNGMNTYSVKKQLEFLRTEQLENVAALISIYHKMNNTGTSSSVGDPRVSTEPNDMLDEQTVASSEMNDSDQIELPQTESELEPSVDFLMFSM